MTCRFVGCVLGAVVALHLSAPARAQRGGHGRGHGGGHAGGHAGGFHGGGAHFGGHHPAGGFHPAAPAFNRTPSFSTPRAFARPHYAPAHLNPGLGRGPAGRPGIAGRSIGSNHVALNRAGHGPGPGWHNPYLGYHQRWFHGYWNGHHPGWGWRGGNGYPGYGYWGGYGGGPGYGGLGWGLGPGLGMGLGMGMGYGLTSWLFGPMLYNWGYSRYSNPYYGGGAYRGTTVVQQPILYNYSQPINATAPPPDESVTTQAMSTFEQARAAFKQGDYNGALGLTDQALRQVPNDPSLHEFRALVLFALGRYTESAAALYAVLSVGPGWDWSTMMGLYNDTDTYTRQLQACINYAGQHPQDAAPEFILAYHFLTAGHPGAAISHLKKVVALQPKDALSAQLLQQLEQSQQPQQSPGNPPPDQVAQAGGAPPTQAGGSPPAQPAPSPSNPNPAPAGQEGNLVGTWTAQPDPDTTITVTFPDANHFTWKVVHNGQDQQFQGESSYTNGVLTMAQDQNNAMVGDVVWKDPTHFQFKVLGGGPSDPGLTFTKTS